MRSVFILAGYWAATIGSIMSSCHLGNNITDRGAVTDCAGVVSKFSSI